MSWLLKLYARMKGCCATAGMSRKEAFLGAGLTLGSALDLRGHSTPAKVVLIVGPFLVLFLIGLLAGLAQSD